MIGTLLLQTFFLVPAKFLLISVGDNMVRMDSIRTDFCLVDNAGCNRLVTLTTMLVLTYVITTAISPIAIIIIIHEYYYGGAVALLLQDHLTMSVSRFAG